MDDEIIVVVALCYCVKEAYFDGNEFCPADVAPTGPPTFEKFYCFPMAVEDGSNAPSNQPIGEGGGGQDRVEPQKSSWR